MGTKAWYCTLAGRQSGPYTLAQLRVMLEERRITPQTQLHGLDGATCTVATALGDVAASGPTDAEGGKPTGRQASRVESAPRADPEREGSVAAVGVNRHQREAEAFGLYRSGTDQGAVARLEWTDFLTPRRILVAVAVIVGLVWWTFVIDHGVDQAAHAQEQVEKAQQIQRQIEVIEGIEHSIQPDIDPQDFSEAMSYGY